MASEETKTTESISVELHELKETVDKIRYNDLAHIEDRILNVENKVKTPLTTLYLIIAFVIFIAIVAVNALPSPIGWSAAGISSVLIILAGLAIFRTVKTSGSR